jgi:ribosomal protein S8
MLGLDIRKTRCMLIYPINKMYAISEKKPVSNDQIEIYSTK